MDSRNSTIDIAKGLGIILVVLGHSQIVLTRSPELYRIIFSFHLPLFFFLSGVFLRNSDNFWRFLRKRANVLLKPYFSVLGTIGIYLFILRYIPVKNYFIYVLYATGSTIEAISKETLIPLWFLPHLTPLWFLPHLFITLVFSYLVLKLSQRLPQHSLARIVLYVTIFSLGVIFVHFWQKSLLVTSDPMLPPVEAIRWMGLPFSLDLVFLTSGFVLFGNFWAKQVQFFSFKLLKFVCAVMVFFAFHHFYNETIDLNNRLFGNFLICTLQAFLGIYIILSISSLISQNKVAANSLSYIGCSSLFILMFHWVVMDAVMKLTHIFSRYENANGLVAILAGVVLPVIFQNVSKRHYILAVALLPSKVGVK